MLAGKNGLVSSRFDLSILPGVDGDFKALESTDDTELVDLDTNDSLLVGFESIGFISIFSALGGFESSNGFRSPGEGTRSGLMSSSPSKKSKGTL